MKKSLMSLTILILVIKSGYAADKVQSKSTLTWTELPSLPDPLGVAGPFAGVHDDALIVAGGANFPKPVWETEKQWHDNVFVLVKKRGGYEWIDGGHLPRPLAYGATISTPDGVVCMGGNDGKETYANVFLLRWNSSNKSISATNYPSLPKPCAFGQAAVIGNVIYLAGGQSDLTLDSAMNNFWSLDLSKKDDPDRFAWKELKELPGPSRALNITVVQYHGDHHCLYVMSGRRQDGHDVQFLKDVWQYTPDVGTWQRRADLPQCVMAGTGIGYGRRHIFILGGANGSLFFKGNELKDQHPGFPKEAFVFDTKTDSWKSAGSIPQNHVTTTAVMWDDRIIIPSGEIRPRVRSAKVWMVEPAQ